jgi:HTH-type transcriptional regulator/antitoxin HigA
MNIKPIRTPIDHTAALKEVERLWDKAQPGTPDGDKFEVLSALVDAYERVHFKIPAPDPIEAIRFRMEQEGLTTKDLLPIFKTRARASEVMAKKRRLNLANDPAAARPAVDPHRVPGAGLQAQGGERRRTISPSLKVSRVVDGPSRVGFGSHGHHLLAHGSSRRLD